MPSTHFTGGITSSPLAIFSFHVSSSVPPAGTSISNRSRPPADDDRWWPSAVTRIDHDLAGERRGGSMLTVPSFWMNRADLEPGDGHDRPTWRGGDVEVALAGRHRGRVGAGDDRGDPVRPKVLVNRKMNSSRRV